MCVCVCVCENLSAKNILEISNRYVLRPFRMRIFDITDEMVSDKWLFGTYKLQGHYYYYCPLGCM